MKKQELFSVDSEPALQRNGQWEADPAERRVKALHDSSDEYEKIRDSVFNEPVAAEGEARLIRQFDEKALTISLRKRFFITLLSAILGGLLAIPGTLFGNAPGWGGILYVVIAGPMIEEFFKQSGMLYLLEKKPFYVTARWQFILVALSGGLLFGVLENLIYQFLYLQRLPAEELARVMEFRWIVCTALHICCSLIASFGLFHAWKQSKQTHKLFTFQYAWCYFGIAVAVHGLYNLWAILQGI